MDRFTLSSLMALKRRLQVCNEKLTKGRKTNRQKEHKRNPLRHSQICSSEVSIFIFKSIADHLDVMEKCCSEGHRELTEYIHAHMQATVVQQKITPLGRDQLIETKNLNPCTTSQPPAQPPAQTQPPAQPPPPPPPPSPQGGGGVFLGATLWP